MNNQTNVLNTPLETKLMQELFATSQLKARLQSRQAERLYLTDHKNVVNNKPTIRELSYAKIN
jgi:hypothetical protein